MKIKQLEGAFRTCIPIPIYGYRIHVIFTNNFKQDFDTIKNDIYNKNKGRSETAITKYSVLDRKGPFSVLEVEPVTGRTNQIRIHLQKMGHPIVGESVYAFRKDFALKFKRLCLHAAKIEFKHPVNGKAMRFESPLPEDMDALINRRS